MLRDPGRLHVGVEADEDGRETDEAVEAGNEFRHLGHLHTARDEGADNAADDDHGCEQPSNGPSRRRSSR